MGVRRQVHDWLRTHPNEADVLVALSASIVAALPYFDELRVEMDGQRPPLVIALFAFACACLVLRRRYPWLVWVVTTVAGLVGVVWSQSASPVYVPAVVALYTVSSRVPTVQVAWAAALSTVAPTALLISLGPLQATDDRAYEMVWWAGLAAVTGIAVRSQRAVIAAADDRARRAEATREDEAQRRVTQERLRIARDLHDVVAHHVSVINVQAGVAGHLVRSDPDGAVGAIAHIRQSSQTILREMPGLLGLLRIRDEALETAPVPRLDDAATLVDEARDSGLQVIWETSGRPIPLPPSTDLTGYRVVQEGLTNAGRHSSGQVHVRVAYDEGGVSIEMRNQLPQSATGTAAGRHGLIGMRERVTSVGGDLTVGPAESDMWILRVWLPVATRTDVGHGEDRR